MYALLTSNSSNLPTVVSTNSQSYADLIMSGMYEEQCTGTKLQMLEKEGELLQEVYGEINA